MRHDTQNGLIVTANCEGSSETAQMCNLLSPSLFATHHTDLEGTTDRPRDYGLTNACVFSIKLYVKNPFTVAYDLIAI